MLKNIFRYGSLLSIRGGALVLKFLLTLFIARYIGLDTLGQYGLVVGLTLFFPSLLRFGILQNISREFVGQDTFSLLNHLVTYFICTLLIYLVVAPTGFFLFNLVNENDLFKFNYLWIPLIIVSEHLIADSISILNTLGQTLKANIISLIQAFLNVIPIFIYHLSTDNTLSVEELLSFWTFGNLLCICLTFFFWAMPHVKFKGVKIHFSWFFMKLKNSFFLYINEFVSVFYATTDRYFIAYFMSMKFVGIYTFYLQLMNAVLTLINSSVIQSHKSKLLKGSYSKDRYSVHSSFKRMIMESLLLTLVISVVISLSIPFISKIINKQEIAEYISIFWLLILIFLVRVAYGSIAIVLYAFKKDIFLLKNTIMCISLNVLLVLIISKCSDLYAVPFALLISFSIGLISCIILYKKVIGNA